MVVQSYALGAKDRETAVSLNLVERTAEALCTCVVDDVHLSNRFGELLQALATSLHTRVATMPASEQSFSGQVTPNNGHVPRPPIFEVHESMPPETKPIVSESFERSMAPSMHMTQPLTSADYDPRYATSIAGSAADTSVYMPMNVIPDQHAFQHDPLISFAGLGNNQLGWSGGQDFFDMLGPLLDVQYEQYR